jgi:hypothetical protein
VLGPCRDNSLKKLGRSHESYTDYRDLKATKKPQPSGRMPERFFDASHQPLLLSLKELKKILPGVGPRRHLMFSITSVRFVP